MTFIDWNPQARAYLRKLPKLIASRIFLKVDTKVRFDVQRYLEPLEAIDGYKIRVGDYRLFVDYNLDKDYLVIRSIRHRRNAYKR